jgi:hypothetical protein
LKDLTRYETFTCLREGSRLRDSQIERKPDGLPRYAWKRNTPAVGPGEQKKLLGARALQPHEALLQLQDRDSGKAVTAHSGSVSWNPYRRRWVLIAVESGGKSFLGEVWYAEADTPLGPWVYAVKVVTHDRYGFYNPKQHRQFDKHGGRVLFFEGTYTHTFSGNPEPTPRYDYNQVMYKLDLGDPRLALPVAIYSLGADEPRRFATREGAGRAPIAFFAVDRPVKGLIPVPAAERGEPLFYALPADSRDVPATTTPLYEYVPGDADRRVWSTDPALTLTGYRRAEKPLGRVWRSPYTAPREDKK